MPDRCPRLSRLQGLQTDRHLLLEVLNGAELEERHVSLGAEDERGDDLAHGDRKLRESGVGGQDFAELIEEGFVSQVDEVCVRGGLARGHQGPAELLLQAIHLLEVVL